ncbi:MAG TPA: CDP-alcohol phosphatidyltransferase family protein, partial [Pyrinomonadaceae bacterium]|nr:CDP-alcohol phosphatidyltransferase family protein [Pyrinomonadaceae bacterium]
MSSRIITLPNFLTVIRMVLIPVFVILLYYQKFGFALAVFVTAGVTDGLDGMLARRFNQKSQLGTILDPIADKLLLVTSFITLSMPSIMTRSAIPSPYGNLHLPVPFWVTTAVISRDVFILVGAAAINIVTGFRNFRPSWLGKANTVVQIA